MNRQAAFNAGFIASANHQILIYIGVRIITHGCRGVTP